MKKSPPASFSVCKYNAISPKKIPRPMNCFMTYRVEKQQQIVDQCPGANHRDISKIVAKWWRELSAAEKEPYRVQAAKAKAEHLEKYPEYKYCPKKKASKPRPYKKRPENEFTARDFENKHQLFSLYHDGKLPDPSTLRSNEDAEFILDAKPPKKMSTRITNKLGHEEYPFLGHNDSPSNLDLGLQYSSPYSTSLLYPPVSNMYYCRASVPSQSTYSPSASPYSDNYPYSHEDPAVSESAVKYQLYPDHYGYIQQPPATISYPVSYQYTASDQCYNYSTSSLYTDQSTCHPMDSQGSSIAAFSESCAPALSLLTTQFYYR